MIFRVALVALVALVASPAAWALPKMIPEDRVVPEEGFSSELQLGPVAFTQQPAKDQSMDYLARERSQVRTLSQQLKDVAHDVPISGLMQSDSLSQQQIAAAGELTALADQYQAVFDINARPFVGSEHNQNTDALLRILDKLQEGLDAAEHSINSTLKADMQQIDRAYDIDIARATAKLETRNFQEVSSGTCASHNMKPVEKADCVLAAMILHKTSVKTVTEPAKTTSADYPLGCIYSAASETLSVSSGTAGLLESECDTMGGSIFDNDLCLQQSASFGASDTCADSAHLCSSHAKDMHRCCSKTCNVPTACSINACNALQGEGGCSGLPVDCGSTIDGSQYHCLCQTPFDYSDVTPSCGALDVCDATISVGAEACYNSVTASAVCKDFASNQGWCSSMNHCIKPLTLSQGTAIADQEREIHSDAAERKREQSWSKLSGEQAAVTAMRQKVGQLGLPFEATQQAGDLLQEAAAGPLLSSRHYNNNNNSTISSLMQHIAATISREEESRRISGLVVKWNLN